MDGLQQALLGDAGQREAGLVQRLGALGGGADAHRRERAPDRGEEAGLLGQGAGVGHHREGVHLQAVVVVEAHGLVHAHARVELEARGLQALARARVAGVQDRHVVSLGQGVDRGEQAREVRLGVDVLLAVGGQQHVALGLQAELGEDIGGLDLIKVGAKDLGHGRARDVGALRGAAGVPEVAAGVLGVGQVDVGDHVDDAAVGLLGQALVLAAVAGLHVEDGDMQPLGTDDGEAAVGIAQHQHGIRADGGHQLVALGNDVAHRLAEVGAHGIHIDLGVGQLQIMEKDAVQVIVVVLTGVGQNDIKILAGLIDDGCKPDDLRARADDDKQFQLAVIFKRNAAVISHGFPPHLDFLKKRIRVVRIKRLICPHQRDKILRLAQIDDIVGAARQHMNGLRLLAPHLKFQHLITADAALLNQGVACNNNEKLPLGIVPVLALRDAGL